MLIAKKILLVGEDRTEARGYLEMLLKCLGYGVESAEIGEGVASCLGSVPLEISAILLNLAMPNQNGIETLRQIRGMHPELPVIVVAEAVSTPHVVSAMRAGATDFLCKPVRHEDLRQALNRAVESADPESLPTLQSPGPASSSVFISRNSRMQQIQDMAAQIGWSEAPVLIQGETGSGKEVIARQLHAQSPRAKKLFLKLNCAALPSELVESELFGYERGAFTGAFQRKSGMFELANGGTILLDEIGDMDVRLQAKLLQVLQDHEFQRIGGKETIKVDVRVMAATHRDLEGAIKERTFREDLYYRLNVINIVLPPLRERTEDILPLVEFLMKKHCPDGISMPPVTFDLKQAMTAYHWPGNIRELENFARKFLILRNAEMLGRELESKASRKTSRIVAISEGHTVAVETHPDDGILERVTKAKELAETDAILAALNSTRWNRKQAAVLLQIDYKALLYKMKKLDVEDKPVPLMAGVARHGIARHTTTTSDESGASQVA